MAQLRTSAVQQKREEVFLRGLALCCQFFTVWWRCGTIVKSLIRAKQHRTEWCAATSKYRCMRYGRHRNTLRMPGIFEGPAW